MIQLRLKFRFTNFDLPKMNVIYRRGTKKKVVVCHQLIKFTCSSCLDICVTFPKVMFVYVLKIEQNKQTNVQKIDCWDKPFFIAAIVLCVLFHYNPELSNIMPFYFEFKQKKWRKKMWFVLIIIDHHMDYAFKKIIIYSIAWKLLQLHD